MSGKTDEPGIKLEPESTEKQEQTQELELTCQVPAEIKSRAEKRPKSSSRVRKGDSEAYTITNHEAFYMMLVGNDLVTMSKNANAGRSVGPPFGNKI